MVKVQLITLATRDLGIWLNLKMILHLGSLGKSENKALFNPKPLVARGRYRLVKPKLRRRK